MIYNSSADAFRNTLISPFLHHHSNWHMMDESSNQWVVWPAIPGRIISGDAIQVINLIGRYGMKVEIFAIRSMRF